MLPLRRGATGNQSSTLRDQIALAKPIGDFAEFG
jgi:hypothetical protein